MSSRSAARSPDADLRVLLAELERVLAGASLDTLPEALADLDRVRTLLWTRWLQGLVAPSRREVAPDDRLLGIAEAAELLGISRTAVRRLELAGTLTAVRIGRRLLFRRDVLVRFAEDHERHRRDLN